MITTPAKTKLNQRLHEERRFDAFILTREALKRCGVSDRVAWKLAATRFPPTNGDPLEIEPPDIPWPDEETYRSAMRGEDVELPADGDSDVSAAVETESPPRATTTGDDLEFFVDGSLDTTAELEPNSTWVSDISRLDSAPDKRKPGRPKKNFTTTPYIRDVSDNAKRMAAQVGMMGDEAEKFDALVAMVDETKKSSSIERLEWIYENAATPWELVKPENVPSRGALRMLRWVKASDLNYEKFVTGLWSKTIPAKSQLDQEGRFTDDGRKQLGMLEEFEASLLNSTEVDEDSE